MSAAPASVVLPRTHRVSLGLDPLGDPVELWVAEPIPGVAPLPPGPRRVLWVLDATLFFGTVVETTRLMAGLFGEIPPLLVAGVAYPEADGAWHAALRARDFTPTRDPSLDGVAGRAEGEGPEPGGADAFADLLLGPARSAVRRRYDTVEGADVIFGSSLGGLFVLHLLDRRPESFRGYVAVSPALWWDDGLLLRRTRERSIDDAGARTADVFLAVGRGEEGAHLPFLAPWKLVSNVEAMAGLLAGSGEPGLRVAHAVVEDETHTSVVQPGLTRGLRWVLERR